MSKIEVLYPKGKLEVSDKKMTVLELHRWLQEFMDDYIVYGDNDMLPFTNPSERYTDYFIKINEPFKVTKKSFKHLTQGSLIQEGELYNFDVSKHKLHDDYMSQVRYHEKSLKNY